MYRGCAGACLYRFEVVGSLRQVISHVAAGKLDPNPLQEQYHLCSPSSGVLKRVICAPVTLVQWYFLFSNRTHYLFSLVTSILFFLHMVSQIRQGHCGDRE